MKPYLFIILGLLALALPALAKETVLFTDAFADAKAWTQLPAIDARGPIPANGAWKAENGAWTATGSAAPWTVQTAGNAAWTDYKFSAKVTIRKPTPELTDQMCGAVYDRYLPNKGDFAGPIQHTGQYRFHYYAGEFDWGSDAAVYVRYQDRENCYRVQLSTRYQEIILWHGVGGYLQVVPCKLEAGKTYQLDVLAQGPRIQVNLDGKKVIDYWHECLPTMTGRIGLGAYNATVSFADAKVTTLPAATAVPVHQSHFTARKWRTLMWVFDNNEPIVLLEPDPNKLGGDYSANVMFYHFVKLRPGYRPAYFTFVGMRKNEAITTKLVGTVDNMTFTGQNTDKLTIGFDTLASDKSFGTRHTDVLSYDALRSTYRHDITADITFNKDERIFALEFSDPLTYNNKEPGRSVKYGWLPAGHKWGLIRAEDGTIQRHPISQSLNMDAQNSWHLQAGNGLWILYPDRAVCPTFEHHTPNERTYVGVCHWGYDWHQYVHWGDKPRDIKAGTKFSIKHTFAGYTAVESEKLFRESKLAPQNDVNEFDAKSGRPRNFMMVPSIYAFAVCDPAGTSFDQVYSVREPYIGWQWYGDYQLDRQVGHTDRYSLRLDGPSIVKGMFYHHMIDNYANRYLCTAWLKTKGVKGEVIVSLYYPWGEKAARDTIVTGFAGDTDWQQVSWITTVPCCNEKNYDASEFSLELKGMGTVCLDDFSVRPLADDEQVVEHKPVAGPVQEPQAHVSADYLMYLPCAEGDGIMLIDASGHANVAKLYNGATWAKSGTRSVLHLGGNYAAAFVPMPQGALKPNAKNEYQLPALTLDAWIRPTAGKGGDLFGYGYSPHLVLNPNGKDKFTLTLAMMRAGQWISVTSDPIITADAWTHVAGVITPEGKARLYINGKMVKEQALPEGKLSYAGYTPMIAIGTYGQLYSASYVGDLAEIRWWSRAATDKELADTAIKGQP